ncbi:lipase 1 [Drosophila grimshawi]|uniref:lipase 1 n=1 Tax=Drosophila grimshawi TaxID=7222 RepID=UPI001C932FDA|nr:lipase 1 [Drosophila grimshawi]XP_043070550.1 lipase 1 [Drosophila grimshawi]
MFRFNYCLIWLCLYANLVFANIVKNDPAVLEDAHLRTPGLIKKYGYPFEEHKIDTKDGFRLTAHRIPKRGAQPVLLVHGLQDSSASWVLSGPGKALAYLLSDRGYDVWMLNVRGNRYSRKHIIYHPLQRQFWDFSFHEIGIYDLPATIDYILNRSGGYRKLHYVGHSQGTTAFFVMGAERPAYMKKIKLFQGLAPVVYFAYTKQSLGTFLAPHIGDIVRLANLVGIYEFPPENEVWRELLYKYCTFIFRNTCTYFIMQIAGVDDEQWSGIALPKLLGHFPAGTSVKSFDHYAQQINSGGFFKYNYRSVAKNRRAYGSAKPPAYKLGNVDCKVALYYGKNDPLAAVKDVQHLRNELPNVVYDELLTYKKFNHIDFLVAIDVRKLLYDSMFSVMKRVEEGEL